MKKLNKKAIHFFIFLFFGGALIFFFYQPQPVLANDFSGDPSAVSLYNLEPSALTTDSKGTNTINAGTAPASDAVLYKQGVGSGNFYGDSPQRIDANLSNNFPFKTGTTNYLMSLAFWFRPDVVGSSPGGCLVSKYTAGGLSWAIWYDGDEKISFWINTSGGTQYVTHNTVLSINTWYHVTVTINRTSKAVTIRLKDTNGDTVGTDIDTTHGGTTSLNITSAPFAIGAYGISYNFDGRIDEFVVFNDILTAEESTAIAKGTYGGAPAETLFVSLSADPSSGTAPLDSVLTADVSGTAIGTVNYSFWWNCSDPTTSVSAAQTACGSLPTPVAGSCVTNTNGAKCDEISNDTQNAPSHSYPAGSYSAKVIVEKGAAPAAQSQTSITSNNPPTANAGSDQAITLPTNSVTISGASESDTDGTIASRSWTRTSGPSTPTIGNGTTLIPTFSNLIEGTYIFRLTVTDNLDATGYDEISIVVSPAQPDTEAPVISNVWPTESDVVSYIGIVLSLQTDEHATCKYDIENRSFDEMLNVFSGPTAAPAIDSGLIGYWKFDETTGTQAADSSISNKPGTLYNGPVWTAGKINNALLFDGVNDYVDMGDQQIYDADPGDKLTILGWIKGGAQSSNKYFFWKEGGCIGWGFALQPDGNIIFHFRTGTGCTDYTTYPITTNDIRYDDNQWHLVAGVFDRPNNLMELFVDGESKGTATLNNAAGDGVGRLRIGTNWDNSKPFSGMIDDVRIYNWPLSAPQIQQLYMDETFYYTGALPDLERGKTYTYYAKCQDDFGNTTSGYPISFTVSEIITGGLWGHYNTIQEVAAYSYSNNTIKDAAVETVNFYNNFDPILLERTGQIANTSVIWKGAIFAEKDGTYNFRLNISGNWVIFEVDGLVYQGSTDGSGSKYLTAGWHDIFFILYVFKTQLTANTQMLYWTPPGESEEIIPADHLSPQNWSDLIITIPDISKPMQPINYILAGSGSGDAQETHPTNLAIEVSLPSGVAWEDVKPIEDEVWIYWFYSDNPVITITNNNTGLSRTITGTQIKTVHGFNKKGMLTKVPPELIPDSGNGNLSLSFDTTFTRADGVSILIPYYDATRPEGRISIRAAGDSEYWSVSKVMVYPLDGLVNNDIRPFFIFGDGETKIEMPTSYRPNYIVMLSGTGAPPSDFAFLQKIGGTKLIPENPASLSLSSPETWYPVFGREGPQLDVLSPYPNYQPNSWPSAPDTGYGYIKNISVPSENTWIAFQYYSSNFPEDGVDGSGESTMMMAGGVFSSISLEEEVINSPPKAENLQVVKGDYCSIIPVHSFSWTYSDDDGDNQSQFQFQVDNNADFISPEVDMNFSGLSNPSPSTNNQLVNVAVSPLPGSNQIEYNPNWPNPNYYWRVRVWDDQGGDSNWVYPPGSAILPGDPFATEKHRYPEGYDNFSMNPENPEAEESIQFTDNSICYDDDGACDFFSWDFLPDGDPLTSSDQNPIVKFPSGGTKSVTLKVTDSDGYYCIANRNLNFKIRYFWREISPWW
ncbi:MAG: hypothetical protein A2Y98_03540 [Candidatus Portnoybacteria bacterium RBG_19FT_COMBO_36_7]|uniref:PA14 domain-containing protein n=1 Tax=Candidatus Portnoybacteria bacterium RBG_19FT_COMBO_36_7 TaxID=1801992 RepID=A0A1G2F972_9BACT|nr:MAG: hypothetical protein A2Y98_03540 [Candidatus Portnoybacteria bacterium RBG_19FT_COMBO_36_7]